MTAYDPSVKTLPADLAPMIDLAPGAVEALAGASALVIATAWPQFQSIDAEKVAGAMRTALVLDPASFLAPTFRRNPRLRYVTVGRSST